MLHTLSATKFPCLASEVIILLFFRWFLHIRYEAATRHYIKTQDMYYKNYLSTNSLFLYSRADQVASPRIITDLANCYHDLGYEVSLASMV